jgi:hypothetical protein
MVAATPPLEGQGTAIGGTNINSTAFSASAGFKDKILTMSWVGARYAVAETVDMVGAYYHETHNDFAASPANVKACATLPASKNNFCAGTVDAALP